MNKRDFSLVFDQGRPFREEGILLHLLKRPDRPDLRLVGFAVSRKVGNAVVRNLVRRRLRHAVRGLSGRLSGGAMIVLTARASAAEMSYTALQSAVERVLARAGVLASTVVPPSSTVRSGPSL